jgi:hypothetical protein
MSDAESLRENATVIVNGLEAYHASLPDLQSFEAAVTPQLSLKEREILHAYDQLLELELETSLIAEGSNIEGRAFPLRPHVCEAYA